jgi:hypothetical protein
MKAALTPLRVFVVFLMAACEGEKSVTTEPVTTRWKCKHCNEWHTELPFTYGPLYPDPYLAIPEAERDRRAQLDKDFCIIDGEHFLVRGRLEIPVRDSKEILAWDVWVSLSKANFDRTIQLLESEGRESEPPYFGWLCTSLSIYPDTTHLKTVVQTRPVGMVPTIRLEPSEHPLAVEQRDGIGLDRVREIASLILHPDAKR